MKTELLRWDSNPGHCVEGDALTAELPRQLGC